MLKQEKAQLPTFHFLLSVYEGVAVKNIRVYFFLGILSCLHLPVYFDG